MRYAKKVAVAGAAMLISVGPASAGQEPRGARGDEATAAERQPARWSATPSEASGPDAARTAPGTGAGVSRYVTTDELDRRVDEVVRGLERTPTPQTRVPAPTFTDQG